MARLRSAYFTAFSASKAALVRFTELIDKNIQVKAIGLCPVKSRMWDELRAAGDAGGPQALEELRKMEATGSVPADRAVALVLFLVSSNSNGLIGRLITTIHDKLEELGPRIPQVMSSDDGTLRRVPLG